MVYCLQIVMGQVLYATMQHKVAAVGDSVLLRCHTNLSHSVDWSFMKTEDSWHERQIIFENNMTHENYIKNSRIRSEVDWLHGDYNMKIFNATLNDSGLYVCIEDGSVGDKHAIDLKVIG
jgi:Immunoglobulin V-set domain